jgi:ABC-2 type transport system permease protein
MRILDLALKDLLQIIRDRKSALFLLFMPLAFTVFFGMLSGGSADTRLPTAWINADGAGVASAQLQRLLNGSDAIRLTEMRADEEDKAALRVRDGKLAGVILVPAGFSADLLAGKEPALTLIADSRATVGHTVRNAVQAGLLRVLSSAKTAQLSAAAVEKAAPFADAGARQQFTQDAFAQAAAAWDDAPIGLQVEGAVVAGEKTLASSGNAYLQSSPGMIVQFAVYALIQAAMVLVLERKHRALTRMLTTPTRRWEIIAGHILAMFLVVLLQQAILIAFGQLAFGVDYMRQPLATLLVMVALSLWVACLGLFIGAISRREEQVIMWALVAMFVFSGLGGAWFPLEFAGKTFATIGHLTPTAWAMDGFQNIILRGLGFGSVLAPAGVLTLYAALFFGLALWRFRFE